MEPRITTGDLAQAALCTCTAGFCLRYSILSSSSYSRFTLYKCGYDCQLALVSYAYMQGEQRNKWEKVPFSIAVDSTMNSTGIERKKIWPISKCSFKGK